MDLYIVTVRGLDGRRRDIGIEAPTEQLAREEAPVEAADIHGGHEGDYTVEAVDVDPDGDR